MVAKSLGRYYLGCELHDNYSKLIEQRLDSVTVKQPTQEVVNPLELLL